MTGLGIIAGQGGLPLRIAERAMARGHTVYVARIGQGTDPALEQFAGGVYPIGAFGGVSEALRAAGCRQLVFAGRVARPNLEAIELDALGTQILPGLLAAGGEGDDALLQYLIGVFEAQGFEVLGGRALYGDLICPAGEIGTGATILESHQRDLARAMDIAKRMGAEDIGQAAIVCDGLVLAVEAQEGTDAMLKRAGGLPSAIRGTVDARRGVLVKCAKPGQDERIDLPTIGMRTVELAAAAGLAGIGLEAGSAIILERDAVRALAASVGLFVTGLSGEGGL